jgi:predicted PurR-regulated permease PerM
MGKKWQYMTDLGNSHRGTRLLIIAAALVIIIWGINQAQSVLVLLLVSSFLAVIGTVPVLWMERKRIPTVAAVLIVVAAMVMLLLSIGVIVGASLNNFSDALPFYQTRIHDMLLAYKALLASKGIAITDKVLFGYINPGVVMNLTATMFTALSSVLSNVLLILFTVIFILLEASSFPVKLRSVLDNPQAVFPQVTRFVHEIKRYMVIKTLLNLVGAVLVTIWLYILGVDFPILWGFLAFLLHFVPSIGSIVAAIPAVLLALVQLGGESAALTATGYLVIGTILGNIVEPRVMGRRLGMSTLVVFLSLIFWGYLLGVVGALLCVPLTMTVKLACEASEDTQWIAVLLGPEIVPEGIPAETKRGI